MLCQMVLHVAQAGGKIYLQRDGLSRLEGAGQDVEYLSAFVIYIRDRQEVDISAVAGLSAAAGEEYRSLKCDGKSAFAGAAACDIRLQSRKIGVGVKGPFI